jgi:four helix bundle protein
MAGIRRHEDLFAWQLSEQLKERVFLFTAKPAVSRNQTFCDDIRRSARSSPANLAEGFALYWPRENARFVRYALGSLGESRNHLFDALKEKYITQEEFNEMARLVRRAMGAATKWHQYLMSCPPGDPTPWLHGNIR